MNRNRRGMTRLDVLVLVGVVLIGVTVLLPKLGRSRELARRAACAMNLGDLGKGISLYQAGYKEKYPALTNRTTLAQGSIDEEPEMVAIADPSDESTFFTGDVKGNGSVNAYYLLVAKGYVEEECFKCPVDESYRAGAEGTDAGRGNDLGFDGWANLSYAFQPTSVVSARPGPESKGSMVIASDQVVDQDTPLNTTDNRPKENNAVNHGYEYVNVLLVSNSVKKLTRKEGADSTVSKWGYEDDEIFTKTQSADPVKQANDSILMGKEGAE